MCVGLFGVVLMVMLMWLCVFMGVFGGNMCSMLFMFRCSRVLLILVCSSRYFVCCFIDLIICLGSSLVILCGIG